VEKPNSLDRQLGGSDDGNIVRRRGASDQVRVARLGPGEDRGNAVDCRQPAGLVLRHLGVALAVRMDDGEMPATGLLVQLLNGQQGALTSRLTPRLVRSAQRRDLPHHNLLRCGRSAAGQHQEQQKNSQTTHYVPR